MQETGIKTVKGQTVDHDGDILDRSIIRTNLYLVFQNEG